MLLFAIHLSLKLLVVLLNKTNTYADVSRFHFSDFHTPHLVRFHRQKGTRSERGSPTRIPVVSRTCHFSAFDWNYLWIGTWNCTCIGIQYSELPLIVTADFPRPWALIVQMSILITQAKYFSNTDIERITNWSFFQTG